MKRKTVVTIGVAAVAIAAAAQLVPYGRDVDNPPVVNELAWHTEEVRDLARRACFDCHSNETTWPWYAKIAPVSWVVYHDVAEGRKELNFSDWKGGMRKHENMKDIHEEVNEGEMPPLLYRVGHKDARLSDAEKKVLLEGLARTVPADRPNRHDKE